VSSSRDLSSRKENTVAQRELFLSERTLSETLSCLLPETCLLEKRTLSLRENCFSPREFDERLFRVFFQRLVLSKREHCRSKRTASLKENSFSPRELFRVFFQRLVFPKREHCRSERTVSLRENSTKDSVLSSLTETYTLSQKLFLALYPLRENSFSQRELFQVVFPLSRAHAHAHSLSFSFYFSFSHRFIHTMTSFSFSLNSFFSPLFVSLSHTHIRALGRNMQIWHVHVAVRCSVLQCVAV